MDEPARRAQVAAVLRGAGARCAFVHGSRAAGGRPRAVSDLDVAAWWRDDAPASFEVDLPDDVDLLVLNSAPLELAGRVAMDGELLLDDDPPHGCAGWRPPARSTPTSCRGSPARTGSSSMPCGAGMVDEARVARLLRSVDDDIVVARLADLSDLDAFVAAVAARL